MRIEDILKLEKPAFTVIGKEGSTEDGESFIEQIWQDAGMHLGEIAQLAKRGEDGSLEGIWGIMSDFSRSFKPWEEDYTKGLYLAGIEVRDDAEAPAGWTKWVMPASEYLRIETLWDGSFAEMIKYMQDNNIELVGAVYDYTDPRTQRSYMYFPIRRL